MVQEQQFGGQQHQMRPNDVSLILNRLKEARTSEERERIFTDLRFNLSIDHFNSLN